MEIQAKPIQWQDNSSSYYWDVIYGFTIEYFHHRNYYRIFKNNKLINNQIYESIDEAKSQCQQLANEHVKAIAEVKQDSCIDTEKFDIENILAVAEANESARAKAMPTEEDALTIMFAAYQRLKELGFSEACYCPKDGSIFDAIEAGSTGIHPCHYNGEWPTGHYMVHNAGDLWPSSPILFRKKIK